MKELLAINGGPRAKTTPNYDIFPGGSEIGEEEKKQILEVLDHKYLFRYYAPEGCPTKVGELERRWAKKVGSKYALATSSCTGALITACVAAGVGPGDEVIVCGHTYIASAYAVVVAKGIPVFSDIDETLTMDIEDLKRKITPSTKAIMPVHMRGAVSDMDSIMAIAKEHNLVVIEDCAQASGATYKGKPVGTIGDVGCFSFQYYKTITAGEGGMIVTNNEYIYERSESYHDSAACWRPDRFAGQRYEGELFCGANFRMSELAGAVMLAQLDKLDPMLASMRKNHARIAGQIKDTKGIKLRASHDPEGDTGICLMFMLESEDKAGVFAEALKAEGVACEKYFDINIPDWHMFPHFTHIIEKKSASKEGCPWTCPYHKGPPVEYSKDMNPNILDYLGRSVHLHVMPKMTDDDCDMAAQAINKVAAALLQK